MHIVNHPVRGIEYLNLVDAEMASAFLPSCVPYSRSLTLPAELCAALIDSVPQFWCMYDGSVSHAQGHHA